MIASIKGNIIVKKPPIIVIEVMGIGYELQASMHTCYALPHLDDEVMLHTHMVVREDVQALYGFTTVAERDIFRLLIKISGVGPKMALALLSGMEVNALLECVEFSDLAKLQKVPGVGKKTAERLMIELRSKLLNKNLQSDSGLMSMPIAADATTQDAIEALISLGYKPSDAGKVISKVINSADVAVTSSSELIKLALRELA